jgi:hypothetical protein
MALDAGGPYRTTHGKAFAKQAPETGPAGVRALFAAEALPELAVPLNALR